MGDRVCSYRLQVSSVPRGDIGLNTPRNLSYWKLKNQYQCNKPLYKWEVFIFCKFIRKFTTIFNRTSFVKSQNYLFYLTHVLIGKKLLSTTSYIIYKYNSVRNIPHKNSFGIKNVCFDYNCLHVIKVYLYVLINIDTGVIDKPDNIKMYIL
jgi:hypothetical protein